MKDYEKDAQQEIHSKVLRAGRRTYFFDVRSTRADDFYLTITESKKHTNDDGSVFFKKHKIYLYKEDFEQFQEMLRECTEFIIEQRGEEVISERHEPNFQKKHTEKVNLEEETNDSQSLAEDFTDLKFDDI